MVMEAGLQSAYLQLLYLYSNRIWYSCGMTRSTVMLWGSDHLLSWLLEQLHPSEMLQRGL